MRQHEKTPPFADACQGATNISANTPAPFFIVGCGRSGTTLLKSILSAHPYLFVMPETFFFKNVYPRVSRYSSAPWHAAKGWWLADMGITPKRLEPLVKARMRGAPSAECALLGAIFDFHAAAHPGATIGEKTPEHVNHLERIWSCFPNARIIQIIRDPRAVTASFRKVKVGSNAIADITSEWSRTARTLESWSGTEGFLALRYEDLVSDPNKKLHEICTFLGVDWTSEVLEFHSRDSAGYAPEQVHHANTRKPLFRDSIDSWRDELSKSDVALVEWALRDNMARHGYIPVGDTITIPSVRMIVSRFGGQLHRLFVRAPRQRLKALAARRRLARGA